MKRTSKRFTDLLISSIALIVLLPLLILVAFIVWCEDGRPVFFRQERVGLQGRLFRIWKFRTMKATAAGPDLTVGGDSRITRVGGLLRRLKLDELPQLLNVWLGEMSLVGPRPEIPKYVMLYDHEQRQLLNYLPGITAPASLKYVEESLLLMANSNPEDFYVRSIMPDKIKIDLQYSQNATWFSDMGLLFKTVRRIWSGAE